MLDPSQWQDVLNRLVGTVTRGIERISTATALDALEVPTDRATRQKVAKRIAPFMRSLGWRGPKTLRWDSKTTTNGYWRSPGAIAQVIPQPGLASDGALGDVWDEDLPRELLGLVRGSMKDIRGIQRLPLDETNGNLLRAKITAAGIVFNAQLRADEQRLRAKQTDDVLERLGKIIEQQKKLIPPVAPIQAAHELERSDAEASVLVSGGDGSEEACTH